MKKFFKTFEDIWAIKELRERIIFTLLLLAVFRFGSYVILPGVDSSALQNAAASRGNSDLLGLINSFTGGAFNNAAVFALGIMPYITASIIIQLLGFAVPYFQRLQQKEGESGRKKLTQITRMLTVLITLVQGSGYLALISSTPGAVDPTIGKTVFWFSNLIILSTGTIFAMWLGEKITDKGLGNGVSLLIMIGIIASLPSAFISEFTGQLASRGPVFLAIELALFFFVILATILIVQGVRRIPIQFAKRMVGRDAKDVPSAGSRDYIPLKVNAAGVMPIIFAQAIMFLPIQLGTWATGSGQPSNLLLSLSNWKSSPYNLIFFILIVVLTYI